MANAPDVGKLERVNLREIWGDEARNFTPWLASPEALALLSDVIGFELELIGIEVAVGPYSADILAKAAAEEDNKVIIENQLGKTDHDHLGKLITYAAGLGAKTLIWISDRFCDEHREALDWLNYNSAEKVAFFGLEIRAFRIDKSRPAPQFSIISSPNVTAKAAREKVASADRPSSEDLMATAMKRHVEGLAKILLKLGPPDEWVTPVPNSTYGGSFRCWRKDPEGTPRMVMGINISGKRKQTPDGQLDVWLPVPSLAAVCETSAEEVRGALDSLPVYLRETVDWVIRVTSDDDAEKVVQVLSDFFDKHPGIYADNAEKPSDELQ